MVVLIILAVLASAVALLALGAISWLGALLVILVGLMAAVVVGERLDRSRQHGRHDPAAHFDRNRGDFHGEQASWTTPTPYIDHPDGGGTPPGVYPARRG